MTRLPYPLIALAISVALPGTLGSGPDDPCSPEEIARLKAEYTEKTQQLEDLQNAQPMVDQLSEIRGYMDVLNEAAGGTKEEIAEFVEDNERLLDNLKTEVTTQNQNTQRWAQSVYSNDAWEDNTSTVTREVSVTSGLNVTAEKLGKLEDLTGDISSTLQALEQGMRAQTPAEQLAAFQNYFDTMTGFVNNDEMKAAFPVLYVFAPWFEYFSKAIEFAAVMTEDIQRSAEMRNRMLAGIAAAGSEDAMINAWFTGISYTPPTKSPYEMLEEKRQELEARLDEIAAKLEDCGQAVPATATGGVATGPAVDRYAFPEAEFGDIMELCHERTGIDPTTAAANEAELRRARARAVGTAHGLSRLRWKLGIPDGKPTDNPEVKEAENKLRTAIADYESRLEPVNRLRNCVFQYYWGFFEQATGVKPTNELNDLPDRFKYEPYKNLDYWEINDLFAQASINRNLPEPSETGNEEPGGPAPSGAGGAKPEAGEEPGVPAPDVPGDVSAPGAPGVGAAGAATSETGGTETGAVLGTGTPIPLTEEVDPIDFEIEPDTGEELDDAIPPSALPQDGAVPTQGSDAPVTGESPGAPAPEGVSYIDPATSAPLLNSPFTVGSVDPTTQPMMLDLIDLELGAVEAFVPMREDDRSALQGHGGGMYLAADGSGGVALLVAAAERADEPKVAAFLTSLGVSTGEAFDLVALNEGDLPVRISGDGIVVEPVQLEDEAKRQLQSKLADLAGRNPVTAKLNAYCLEFLARPPTAGQLFRIASGELQDQFAPMRNILKAGRGVFENGLLNPDSDPVSYMHSIKQWALWSYEKGFDLGSFTDAFLEHTKKNFEAAGRDWNGEIEDAVRAVLPNRWNDIQQVLRVAAETGPSN